MTKPHVVRAFVIDDEEIKHRMLERALHESGGEVVAKAYRVSDLRDLHEEGILTPDNIDVAFIDAHLNSVKAAGMGALSLLAELDIVRTEPGTNPNKIVAVGSSSDPEYSRRLGSYSEILDGPLTVDWETMPLNVSVILNEVRRLKALPH